jgi:hypothetical protein
MVLHQDMKTKWLNLELLINKAIEMKMFVGN